MMKEFVDLDDEAVLRQLCAVACKDVYGAKQMAWGKVSEAKLEQFQTSVKNSTIDIRTGHCGEMDPDLSAYNKAMCSLPDWVTKELTGWWWLILRRIRNR